MSELLFRPAGELAALVRAGALSALELVNASLARIEALQPHVGAFTFIAAEEARAAAREISAGDPRPFAGVPIAVKDNRPVAGMPLTMGSHLWGDFRPDHDAFLVRRLRSAGFVIVGKTALPEMGILPTTESRRFGPTRNPWDLGRTPGGSSGGSAAAVAAGMVPIAHGNDGGGSTRIPAACCGLVGLKPVRGRVSVGPDAGTSFLTVDGVLTRTVADTAAALDILAGNEPGDPWLVPPFERPCSSVLEEEPRGLRIGLALNPPLEHARVDPACEGAARQSGELLESLGHHVELIEPPWSELDLLPDFTRAFGPHVSMVTEIGGWIAGRAPSAEDVEPLTWTLYQRAREQDTIAYLTAQGRLESVARGLVGWLSQFDAVLTPSLAQPPVAIGEIHGCGQPDPMVQYRRSAVFTPFTAIVNVTGLPAVSLPLYHGEDGLPLGVQLIGRAAGEQALLALAAQVERAAPWAERRPELPA